MALDKNIAPGTVIKVKSLKGKTAGIWVGGSIMNSITLWDPNALGQAKLATSQVGDTLTVIKNPVKCMGSMCVGLKRPMAFRAKCIGRNSVLTVKYEGPNSTISLSLLRWTFRCTSC